MVNRLGNLCPNIVRVYGRSIEAYDFPIPGKSFLSRRSTHNAKADEELRSVALHHLIRQKGKPFAEEIKKYDTMFKKSNYQADQVNVKAYLKFLRDASIAELKEHDVILCTTAVGSNPKIQEGTDIFQVIYFFVKRYIMYFHNSSDYYVPFQVGREHIVFGAGICVGVALENLECKKSHELVGDLEPTLYRYNIGTC